MNTAFPGTTPWERLGVSSPGGGIASAQQGATINANNQNQMQMKDILARLYMNDRNNEVTAFGYGSPFGVQSALDSLRAWRSGATPALDVGGNKAKSETLRNQGSNPYSTFSTVSNDLKQRVSDFTKALPIAEQSAARNKFVNSTQSNSKFDVLKSQYSGNKPKSGSVHVKMLSGAGGGY